MSYYEVYKQYKEFPFADFFQKATPADVLRSLQKEHKGPMDFLTLLSPAAQQPELLEAMAQQAHRLTEQNFGKTITLFTPLYLANICENACVYCGFNRHNHIKRSKPTTSIKRTWTRPSARARPFAMKASATSSS